MIVDFVITVSVSVINFWRMFIVVVISSDNILTITFTGEVTSKVMVVVSISRPYRSGHMMNGPNLYLVTKSWWRCDFKYNVKRGRRMTHCSDIGGGIWYVYGEVTQYSYKL